jgi:hypothetical protein
VLVDPEHFRVDFKNEQVRVVHLSIKETLLQLAVPTDQPPETLLAADACRTRRPTSDMFPRL